MGRRKVSLLHWRLLIQILFLSCIVNASKVLDEVPIPEDSELVQSHLRRRRFPVESDDEDFAASAEGSAELEEGSTPTTTVIERRIPTISVIPRKKTVYYRVLVNFTTSIEYDPQLEDFESETFREVSEGIIDTLESEFYRIPGDQSVTVVWIKQEDQNVIVELDVGSGGNSNDEEIRDVVYSVVRSGSIGPYETSVEGFKFRHLGEDVITLPRECGSNEFSCGSGECVPLDYRCDSRADCSDMSDEDNCADIIGPFTTSTTPTTTPIITAKPERRTPRPLVPTVPTTPIVDVLRPCPIDKAVCQNGQCIPRDYLCDGERDCIDNSDELDCGTPSPCEPNEFKCKNGRCALKLWHCDGDNDCGDNSDEVYCPTKGPGDMCAPEQFVCVSTQTCIPASYQCDEETDCPDRSDEFGCTPPQVITPPEETVMVKRGATVTLTCVAAGVPTPIITWRLNWGHIPVTSRVTMTSQNGQGTLIIRDVKQSDQGAYTCEAINAKGMIFAIPDALLILKSNPGICHEGHFNVQGSLQCVPCFCFGATRNCESTSHYRSQIHLRFTEEDNYMGVNVTVPAQPVTPPLSTSQMIVDPDSGEFQLVDISRRFLNHDSFWTLPRQFLGNQVDSYGGFLRYKIRYSVARGQAEPEQKADVIIIGNGRKLIYKTKTPTQPDVINQKEILFTEDNWQHESGTPVTREDLMMTLVNLDKIMIRTKYDNKMASVGLSDIVMDTTSVEFTTLGKPLLVEQCRCPLSYKGLSCETCAHGFKRVLTGPYLGVCDGCSCNGHASSCDKVTGHCLSCQHNTEGPHCDRCKAGFFGKPTRGTTNDCMPCPCPFTDSRRRFSDTCFLDTDGRPTCDACSVGYTGRRCEICAPGYEGNPMTPGGKCRLQAGHISNCDNRGTDPTESYDGSCPCKANVVGRLCDECSTGSFNLDDSNVDGCLKCFCMGISKECASSSWHRDQVQALYDERERNLYMLTNMAHTQRITEGVQISGLSELTFANFDTIPRDIYYWVLPERFKGDKVTSYGGELRYTILHNVSPGSSPITGMPDVILQGNNIFLEHYTAKRPQPGIPSTFSVTFKESAWRRADGLPSTREHLLMALASINVFMIRASYTEGTTESRISQIHMDVAVPNPTGQKQAVEVEECICPEGYKGSSCQECAFGYTRTATGLYLGMCERCDCNGHSDCDGDTGKCLGCQHNTEGLRCEQCGSGFYGDAKGGTSNDCRPCPCPATTPSTQFSPTCFQDTDGQPTCDRCPSGYEGRNCERCAPGYTGNPIYGQSCTTGCTCDWRGSTGGHCDAFGQCQCKPNVQGRTCDTCKAGYFYLSAESREGCLPCFCMGVTQQCSSSSYYRKLVASPFVPPNNFQNFSLVNRQRSTRITSGFTVTVRDRQPQLSFGRFGEHIQESYYWQLPEAFQGDKREQFFARIRRGHKKDPSLTEDQLRKDAAIWELLGSSSSFPRVKRSSKSVPDLEEQKRIDDEIWAIITGFTAEHKPPIRTPPVGRNLSNASHPLSRLAATRPAGPPAPSSSRNMSSHSARSSFSSRSANPRSPLPSSLHSPPGYYKQMRTIPQTPSLQAQESTNLISSPVSGPRPGGFEKYSLLYKGFSLLPESNYYWQLSHQYLGNKVTSYGGLLRYTLSYDAGFRGSRVPDADVQIIGNDITLVTYHHHQLQPREMKSFEVMLKEQFWKRPDGQQATREHLLMVLADLDEVLIRATYSTDMISASLSDVSMEIAVPFNTNLAQALQVEECRCPLAYHGLSCQDCAPGYTRTGGGLYLGDCKLCECNGHSTSCHPENGLCSNCLHNTAGESCDRCAPGYYGDATRGTPEDCQPCACPLTIQENQFSPNCESNGDSGYRCTACLPGYTGQHCERCAPGYSGNPRIAGQKCHPVDRNPFLVTIFPERTKVEQGSTVILKCQVFGQAPFYFYWSRADGQPLSSRVQQRDQGEELLIREIKSSDAGTYICTCRNMQNTNSSRSEVTVTVPSFRAITVTVEEPRTQTVRSGITVNFICTAKSQSPAYTLVWTRKLGSKLPNTAVDFNGILTIRNVRPEDAGVYICTGSNMFAMDEGTAVLHVPATAPVATVEPHILTVKQGQTAEFRCTATGNPPPTLEWFGGQGNIISPNAVIQGGLLRIVAVEHSDEAEYSCKASNGAGHHTVTSILYVQSSGNLPQVQISPQRIEVPAGDTVRLYCRAGGHPSPMLSWKKHGGELPPQAKVERTDIGTLIIPSITTDQAGIYLCVGTNAAGSSEGRIEVSVLTPAGFAPTARIQPSPASVTRGEMLELYCHVTGEPRPMISWRKSSGYLTTNHQVQGPVLRIRQATDADVGNYICHVENQLGMQEVAVSVSVTSSAHPHTTAPVVKVHPSRTSVSEGEMLELYCQVTGQPQPRITWYRAAGSLSANHQVDGPRLRILHMTPADIGDYVCRAENVLGMREVKFSVTVTSTTTVHETAPSVTVRPLPTSVQVGEMVELHCQVTGQPEPRITWYRAAGPLTSNHQVQGAVLRILRVSSADVGDYICRAENIYGMQEVKFSVSVTPSNPHGTAPTVNVHPSRTTVREGEMLELHCQVTGQPEPRITWYRAAGPLTTNHQVQGAVLRILRVSPADVGDYICRAENIVGTREVKFSVSVTPSTPQNVPTVLTHPSPLSVIEGEMLELHCQVAGQPQPRITWHRAAGSLTTNHQVQGAILRILRVSKADVGDYICRAENIYGMQEVKFSVSVTPSNPHVTAPTAKIYPSSTSVSEGEMLELRCQVTGQPEPRVTWHRAAGSLTANHQVQGHMLRILRMNPVDVGDYICRAENVIGTKEVRFSVSFDSTPSTGGGPPTVRVQPRPVSITEGQMLELHCEVTGQPEPMITWYKTDGYLNANHQVEGRVLRILQVTLADGGDYICRAENMFGMEQLKFSVSVPSTSSGIPMISTGPQDMTVIQGGSTVFSCQVAQGAQPFSIEWKTPNEPLQDNVKISSDGSMITISQARQRDQGQYKCVARNQFGSASSIMTLIVQGPPTVSISPRGPVRLGVGNSITLECIVMGEPRPTINWRRVSGRHRNNLGRQLPREGDPILTISSARLQDSGTYSCTSSNLFATVEVQVEVIVERSASIPQVPQVTSEEPTLTVTAGQVATLRCSAAGYPTPIIQWSKLRAPLPWQHRIVNESLFIPNVGLQDSGQYICNASNFAGFAELYISLDVETAPYAAFDLAIVTVRVGEIIQLHCLSQGTPPIKYEWSKVNGSLPSRAVIQNGFLQINLAVVSDSGMYRCLVKNKVGQSDAFATVNVKSPPAVKVTPQIEVRNLGSSVEFACSVTGHPEPRIEWFKEGGHLPPNHRISKGLLRIENIQDGNEGVYICRASNPFGQVQDGAKLAIQALPVVMINVRASMQMVMVGGSVEFECQAIGDPQPSIRWSKVDGRLSPNVVIQNGMLNIEHVKESDAGRYRCTATNDAGSVKSEVVLYVQTVPMIAPQPELKEVAIGSTAVFPCLASGYPVPEITWNKLEGDLPPGAYVENNVLTIRSAATEHTGTYVCTATNEQGTETAYAMLKVRERKIPYFTQDPISYIALPTIKDAYHEFEIKITFRPDTADGMIIYNGQKRTTGADFISFTLVGGRPEFRFDVGSGTATIRHPNPISLGEYHTVVLYRNLTRGSLFVDNDLPVNGSSQGNFRGLDLNEELYVGGYPDFHNISKVTGSNSGFMGCIRQLIIQGDEVIFSAPETKGKGISNCPTCKENPCKNGGRCVDSETSSYACHCRTGYTGSNCEHSLALHCHPEACGSDATCVNRPDGLGYNCRCHLGKRGSKCMDGVLITAPSFRGHNSFVAYPPLTNVHNELTIELEFKPRSPSGLMFYSSGQRMKMNDFISVAMLNRHVEFRYDLGSGLAVLQSAKPVDLNNWHRLKVHRHNRDGLLIIDGEKEIRSVSPGKSQGLNLRSPMYLGGVPRTEVVPIAVNVTEGIDGCITEVSVNGKKVDLSYTFTESLNVDQCYDKSPCDRVPCLHGGRCIVTGEYEYQCICANEYQGENCEIFLDMCLQGNPCMNGGTCEKNQCWCPMGYTGSYCELDSPVQYGAFFHDGGYIVLPKQMFPRSSPTAPETIEMEVHTTSLDGILLWQGVKHGENGRGKDFVALGLQNGHVLFSYQLGSGEANILSEDPINDGEWHRITAVREGKRGYIQVDDEEIVRGESKGDKVMVNTKGSVYLGGAPDIQLFTGGKFTSGITGCIRKVVLVNKRPDQHHVQPVDLRVHAEGGVNARECSS